ncbi:hypothetical protein QAD02_017674 [Eretmocerus hayati]|uniref:Uncharacterized protein n=1 Tax=Eretmocerus hayati TaxID=131215 RepID=A0ACC2PHI6_9HYME|nr:hypothetical protein QAD02_017674 [Eretmocerus hayati]
MALSMLACGADGNTAQQMMRSLLIPDFSSHTLQEFKKGVAAFRNVENVTLAMANSIFVAAGWKYKMEFRRVTSDIFKNEVSPLNMNNPIEAAKSVNNWVKRNTNSKIKEIIQSSAIDSDTRMILVNAIYFKGNWAKQFDKEETRNMPFYIDENNKKQVPTMHMEDSFVYGYLKELRARYVVLPYKNSHLKMIIFVPQEINGLHHIEANRKNLILDDLTGENAAKQTINLFLPKFKLSSEIDLKKPLEQLGMTDIFGAANFSKISEEPLYVRKAIHKSYIEVNEHGSEAAAVTAIEIQPLIMNPQLIADRPFYFEIVYDTVPIFTGHVINPTVDDTTTQPQKKTNADRKIQKPSIVKTQRARKYNSVTYEPERIWN